MRIKLLSSGADYYMIKPYKAESLYSCIEMFNQWPLFVKKTRWDAAILRMLDSTQLNKHESGYWYLAACLQIWLNHQDRPPQLKEIYIDVGKDFHVTAKGVESGVHRAARSLAEKGVFDKRPKNKDLIALLAEKIYLNEKQQAQEHIHEHEKDPEGAF